MSVTYDDRRRQRQTPECITSPAPYTMCRRASNKRQLTYVLTYLLSICSVLQVLTNIEDVDDG